jgi:type IV pilus assembly protein PilE
MELRMSNDRFLYPLTRRSAAGRRVAGFTLIELMIVVAVIAVLAAIAYPAYTDSVRKSRRAQAKADLVEYASEAERFRTVNNRYTGFALPHAKSPRETNAPTHYLVQLVSDANTFTITAVPQNDQVRDRCGTLSIDNINRKQPSAGNLADCW